MRAAAFLSGQRACHDRLGDFYQRAELKRLDQVGVEDLSMILQPHAGGADLQILDNLQCLPHGLLRPEDTEILAHNLPELVPDFPRTLTPCAGHEATNTCLLRPKCHVRQAARSNAAHIVPGTLPRSPTKHDGL